MLYPNIIMPNNLDVIAEKLIAMGMIKVKMCIEDVTNRFICYFRLNFSNKLPGGSWRHASIDQHGVIIINNHERITHCRHCTSTHSKPDIVSNFFKAISSLTVRGIGFLGSTPNASDHQNHTENTPSAPQISVFNLHRRFLFSL